MATMTVAPERQEVREDHEEQTRHLLLSGVRNLAQTDESLTHQEETQIVSATTVTLGETKDVAVEVGQELCGMADEVDGLLEDVKDIVDNLLDQDSEMSIKKLGEFFMKMMEQTFQKGISKATMMIIIMFGYALIRRYLKRYIDEDILRFIEQIASLLYQAFIKFGVLDWIMCNGGWDMLKSMTHHISKAQWVILAGAGACILGVGMYNWLA
ncbi:uncharacterized protein [Dysidea avara]|uniref:uncharacterized protein n=1 Tax=Dysidea avara TaxID=196820 RepID=UPI0033173BA4